MRNNESVRGYVNNVSNGFNIVVIDRRSEINLGQ